MIPLMLRDGQLVQCGPGQKAIYLQHCPVCGDGKCTKAWRLDRLLEPRGSIGVVVDCSHCCSDGELRRLIDRRLS